LQSFKTVAKIEKLNEKLAFAPLKMCGRKSIDYSDLGASTRIKIGKWLLLQATILESKYL
jgi:hypothetical protein